MFNIDKFVDTDRDFVVVVEGVFDAILIDGISVLEMELIEQEIL